MCLVMLPLFVYGIARVTGANIFVTAFLNGGVFGYFSRLHHEDHHLASLLESLTDFLGYFVWYLAGDFLVQAFRLGFRWQWVVIAVAALGPLRMIPVYVSMIGSSLDFSSQVCNHVPRMICITLYC